MGSRRSILRRLSRPEVACCLVVALCALVVVGWRLGASLAGQRVFLGLDLFSIFPPWDRMPGATGVTNFYVFDNLDFYLPAYAQIRERLLAGDLPVWSPFTSGGTPLLSIPIHGVLSPVRWAVPAPARLARAGLGQARRPRARRRRLLPAAPPVARRPARRAGSPRSPTRSPGSSSPGPTGRRPPWPPRSRRCSGRSSASCRSGGCGPPPRSPWSSRSSCSAGFPRWRGSRSTRPGRTSWCG